MLLVMLLILMCVVSCVGSRRKKDRSGVRSKAQQTKQKEHTRIKRGQAKNNTDAPLSALNLNRDGVGPVLPPEWEGTLFASNTINETLERKMRSFENCFEAAVLLHHLNSGHERFSKTEKFMSHLEEEHASTMQVPDEVKKEILEEAVTEEDRDGLLQAFLKSTGRALFGMKKKHQLMPDSLDAHHFICGSCGKSCVDGEDAQEAHSWNLNDLPPMMALDDHQTNFYNVLSLDQIQVPTDTKGSTKVVIPVKARSVHQSRSGKFYHLHPEYVSHSGPAQTEHVILCQLCNDHLLKLSKAHTDDIASHGMVETIHEGVGVLMLNENAIQLFPCYRLEFPFNAGGGPPNSVASGVDFGDHRRLGLEEMRLVEKLMVSKCRHFHNVVKIERNDKLHKRTDGTKCRIKAHNIMFRDDSAIVSEICLLDDRIRKLFQTHITIELVGPEGEMDEMAKRVKMETFLQGRAHVVHQWLSVLSHLHPMCANHLPLDAASLSDLQVSLDNARTNLVENCARINDAASVRESDAQDDVADIRTSILTSTQPHDSSEGNTQGITMSRAFVTNCMNTLTEEMGSKAETLQSCLAAIADVFDV